MNAATFGPLPIAVQHPDDEDDDDIDDDEDFEDDEDGDEEDEDEEPDPETWQLSCQALRRRSEPLA